MPNDILICGNCQSSFTDIEAFISHKEVGCEPNPDQNVEGGTPVVTILHPPKFDPNSNAEVAFNEISNKLQDVSDKTNLKCENILDETLFPGEIPIQQKLARTGRKRGRPRKGEEKKKVQPKEVIEKEKEKEKEASPIMIDEHGKLKCNSCKKMFLRERHFISHKCYPLSDYVDISKKEAIGIESDDSEVEEINMPLKPERAGNGPNIVTTALNEGEADIITGIEIAGVGEKLQAAINDISDSVSFKCTPLFKDEGERQKFEDNLNVDLSSLDHMFKIHRIQQEVNEYAGYCNRAKEELHVYSCNTCDKVFKALSHMRHHCLTHTNLKPFKCPKCNYASNSKGNLYTHIRKHTGQFLKCKTCDFKTVNRTHLIEHEAIHTDKKEKCRLCKRDYNTVKSLGNHVRMYHQDTDDGIEYLKEFRPRRQRGTAVLHQCHVCNRKFKKKVDRDRHLFVHNIRTKSCFVCDLCDYAASRKLYLEIHMSKHRAIYRCSECGLRFLSTIQLNQHLNEAHINEDEERNWNDLFSASINMSLYLTEPDGSLDNFGAEYANFLTMEDENEDANDDQDEEEEGVVDEPEIELDKDSIAPKSPSDALLKDEPPKDDTNENQENAINPVNDSLDDNDQSVCAQILKQMSYKAMTTEVFDKIRETFGNLECEFCGRLFYSALDFEPHLQTHTGEKPFSCDKCEYKSISKANLKRHVETYHEKKEFACEEPNCGFVAHSRSNAWKHSQQHKSEGEVECPDCNEMFANRQCLRAHITKIHPHMKRSKAIALTGYCHRVQGKLGKRAYKCPYCSRVFPRANAELRKHVWIHEGVKPYKCSICPYSCRSFANLKSHMLRHSAIKPFVCEHCGKSYKSRTALRWHVRMHKDGKMFKCEKCSYEAVQKSHLKRHMETHDILKKYVCEHCDYSANTVAYMKIHYTRFHKGLQITLDPSVQKQVPLNSKAFKCLSCDYIFGNIWDIKRHLKVRHHIQVESIQTLETNEHGVNMIEEAPNLDEMVVQVSEDVPAGLTIQQEPSTETVQYAIPCVEEMDQRTVDLLQQIIDQAGPNQQITLQSEDQSLVHQPETVIIQQGTDQVVLASSKQGLNVPAQYIIQYMNEDNKEIQIASEQVGSDATEVTVVHSSQLQDPSEVSGLSVVNQDEGSLIMEIDDNDKSNDMPLG